jgi:hypothetical protein
MSKLDNIILKCANKVLDGKEETLGDYIDPTVQQVKDLILELVNELEEDLSLYDQLSPDDYVSAVKLRQKVSEL